jgi:hypothetical protein
MTSSAATLIADSSLDLVRQAVALRSADLEVAVDSRAEVEDLASTRRFHQRNYSTDSSMEDSVAWAVGSVRQKKKRDYSENLRTKTNHHILTF